MTGKTCFSGCVIFAIKCDIINLWNRLWKFNSISKLIFLFFNLIQPIQISWRVNFFNVSKTRSIILARSFIPNSPQNSFLSTNYSSFQRGDDENRSNDHRHLPSEVSRMRGTRVIQIGYQGRPLLPADRLLLFLILYFEIKAVQWVMAA